MDSRCIAIFLTGDGVPVENGKPLMLQNVLFCPALTWCMRAWMKEGVGRFFIVCGPELQEEAAACVPQEAEIALGDEEAYRRDIAAFAGDLPVQEVRQAMLPAAGGMLPIASGPELRFAQRLLREETALRWQEAGVYMLDPDAVYIDPRAVIGPGTTLLPGVILRGPVVIGSGCEIGPNALIDSSRIGDGSVVNASQVYSSELGRNVHVGPFTHIRPNCRLGDGCKAGAYVEIKNASFGQDTKMSHLTYVGDTDVGSRVNFGCGTITSNYDGFRKYRSAIGDDVFIGCNTNLISPVSLGDGAYVAAGTTVTKDVAAGSLAIGRVRQEEKPGWAKKRRELHKKP